jgi:hypothetical protein
MTIYNYTYVIEAIDTNPDAKSGPYIKVLFNSPNRITVPFQFFPRGETDAELKAYIESDLAREAVRTWKGQEEIAASKAAMIAQMAASQLTQDSVGVEVTGSFDLPDFVPVATDVPYTVTMRQARLALAEEGLLATVQENIAQLPEAAQIEWEYAGQVERASSLVSTLGDALGLAEVDLDNLFKLAVTK